MRPDRSRHGLEEGVAALFECSDIDRLTAARRVSQNVCDSVLVRRGSSRAACAVELDGRPHQPSDPVKRCELLNTTRQQAGLPGVRFDVRRSYDERLVRERLLATRGKQFIYNDGKKYEQE